MRLFYQAMMVVFGVLAILQFGASLGWDSPVSMSHALVGVMDMAMIRLFWLEARP